MASEVVAMRARRAAVLVGLAVVVSLTAVPARAAAPDPFDHALRDVAVIARADAWAVGDDLIVHWDGTAWSVAGPSIMRQHTFRAVAARNADDVWVAGSIVSMDQNRPLLLHFDGAGWTRVQMPRHSGESWLTDVIAMRGGAMWAIGGWVRYTPDVYRQGSLVYRSDGSRWRMIDVPRRVAGLAAATPSGRRGLWAVGMVENPLDHPAALRWSGRAWRVDRLPEYERNTFATDIVSLGRGRLTVVGSIWYDAGSDWLAGVYIANYEDGRWTLEKRTPEASLSAVAVGPGGWQLAVGQARPDFRAIVLARDVSGWHRMPVPAPRSSALIGVDIRSATDAWAVGSREGSDGYADPISMHWDGSGWTRVAVPTA
jgi:hypothetical protein